MKHLYRLLTVLLGVVVSFSFSSCSAEKFEQNSLSDTEKPYFTDNSLISSDNNDDKQTADYQDNEKETFEDTEDPCDTESVLIFETDDYHDAFDTDDSKETTCVIEETFVTVHQDDETPTPEKPDAIDPPNNQPKDTEAVQLSGLWFTSWDEFRSFYNYPSYMKRECYFETNELFPSLNTDDLYCNYVEVQNSCEYFYLLKSKEKATSASIGVEYFENRADVSAESIIEEVAEELKKRAEKNDWTYYEVISGDCFSPGSPRPSTKTRKGGVIIETRYVFSSDGCVLVYQYQNGILHGVSIHYGDYEIMVGPGNSDNREAFYSDEALTELTYLFQAGDSRSKILQNIVKAINDKTGIETVIPEGPANNNEAYVVYSNVPPYVEPVIDPNAYTDLPR